MDPALVVSASEEAEEVKVIPFLPSIHTSRDSLGDAAPGTRPHSTSPRLIAKRGPRPQSLTQQPDGKLESALRRIDELQRLAKARRDPTYVRRIFETGEYPYHAAMRVDLYDHCMRKLQCELLKCQRWVQETGRKIVVLFEGRDAAGKGGTIKRFIEHMNPRSARVVALPKPTEREQTQWYLQRFAGHLPAAGDLSVRPLLVQPCRC